MYNYIVAIFMAASCFGYVKKPSSGCVCQKCTKENFISVALHIAIRV